MSLLKMVSNDLIMPIDEFLINHIKFSSLMDSFVAILWAAAKISFYFGSTFIYISLFKKDKIDSLLIKLMVLTIIATFISALLYLLDDVLSVSLKEISYT